MTLNPLPPPPQSSGAFRAPTPRRCSARGVAGPSTTDTMTAKPWSPWRGLPSSWMRPAPGSIAPSPPRNRRNPLLPLNPPRAKARSARSTRIDMHLLTTPCPLLLAACSTTQSTPPTPELQANLRHAPRRFRSRRSLIPSTQFRSTR